jgi:methyl-accepting chemotaxis protein
MKWFNGLRISTRLSIGFGVLCLMLVVVGAIGYAGMQQIMTKSAVIAEQALPGIDNLRNFQAMQESMFTYSQGLLLEPAADVAKEYKDAWAQNNADASAALDRYAKDYASPKNKELAPQMIAAWNALAVADAQTVALYDKHVATGDAKYLQQAKDYGSTTENDVYNKSVELLGTMIDNENAYAVELMAANRASQQAAVTGLAIAILVSLVFGIAVAWVITAGVSKPLERVIAGLTAGADSVTSASAQVASSSNLLADGASEQAANLEETSSSLEEMSGMTRQNADNSRSADAMAREAQEAAVRGVSAVGEMGEAIGMIKDSSDRTAKIIKTIDEIAFQTNLLALNAAVEAARAGDAGKGFAVVAEEVRSLAQRSAEAAKNTSALIEESQLRADKGVKTSMDVSEALGQIAESVNKVTQLAGEIAAASEEQAQGIEQVNASVAQMDRVTQSNAANAEESASASEELSAQARELNDMVSVLITTVRGAKAATETAQATSYASVGVRRGRVASAPARAAVAPARHNPEAVIPLDNDDLADF